MSETCFQFTQRICPVIAYNYECNFYEQNIGNFGGINNENFGGSNDGNFDGTNNGNIWWG